MSTRLHLTRRQALQHGAAGVAAVYLAGCGGDDDSGSDTGSTSIMWDYQYGGTPGSMAKYWQAVKQRAAEADMTLRLTEVPNENLIPRMEAAHAAKKGPTLEPIYPTFNGFTYIKQGVLEPFDDYVGDTSDWILTVPMEGKLYVAPYYAEVAHMVGHVPTLRKAGLGDVSGFASWEEFTDALARLKRAGQTPALMGASDQLGVEKYQLVGHMEFWDERPQLGRFALGELSIDDPFVSGWIERIQELMASGYVNADAADITEQEALDRFLSGGGGFTILYPGTLSAADNPDDFKIVGFWRGPGKLSADAAAGGSGFAMTAYGEGKETAARLMEFLHEPEQIELFVDTTGELPCNSSFDPAGLPRLKRESWEFITDPDNPPDWPHNYEPRAHFDLLLAMGQKLVAGETPASVKQQYAEGLERYRDRNPAEVRLLEEFVAGFSESS
jgi:ABC-type glycerol-3-phosphate transport system substrate-binding protein